LQPRGIGAARGAAKCETLSGMRGAAVLKRLRATFLALPEKQRYYLAMAGLVVPLVPLLGVWWFACAPSAGLCERLCPPIGVRSMEWPSTAGQTSGETRMGACNCMEGSRVRVWPWSRAVAWLTDPAEE